MVKGSFLKKYNTEIFFVSLSSLILLLDQLTKYLVWLFNPKLNLKLLTVHLVKNTGAGFGILKDQVKILAVISLVVAVTVILMYKKIPREKFPQIFFALFLGGIIGNLIDRVFRSYVIDFIDFRIWPAFNIADAAISTAVIGLIVFFWKNDNQNLLSK
ncbi:MAG: signal peptidase II [Nanoarchaeota archaeon]|nr:signal peptidase II [Nanoarchaeota archaeon]MBU1643582.1 signal peptidase II [Nanoarchaeota archaeon]MBU1977178.1 signal peptidase II [Nanoarchaeota archaeon]